MLTLSFCGVGGVVQSHFIVKPNLVLRLGWGFDNKMIFFWGNFNMGGNFSNMLYVITCCHNWHLTPTKTNEKISKFQPTLLTWYLKTLSSSFLTLQSVIHDISYTVIQILSGIGMLSWHRQIKLFVKIETIDFSCVWLLLER